MAEFFAVGAVIAGAVAHRIQQNRNLEQETRIANLEQEAMALKAELKKKADKEAEKPLLKADDDDWVTASRIALQNAAREAKQAIDAADTAILMQRQ